MSIKVVERDEIIPKALMEMLISLNEEWSDAAMRIDRRFVKMTVATSHNVEKRFWLQAKMAIS